MGAAIVRLCVLCIVLLLFPLSSSQEPESDTPPNPTNPTCRAKSDWVTQLAKEGSLSFDATKNCGDLEYILQAVNRDKKFDFCRADRQNVLGYTREGYRPAAARGKRMPEDCEIEQWWFRGAHFPKNRRVAAFCENATSIAVASYRGNKTVTHAQPYLNLVHGPRSVCRDLIQNDLTTIGNPDVAGPCVMASYLIQLLLSAFFCVFFYRSNKDGLQRRTDKSFSAFYTTTMILALSIAVASAVTFAGKRAAPSSFRSDFRLPNIYEYRLLALAPAFAVLPVLVAHTLHYERQQQRGAVVLGGGGGLRRRRPRRLPVLWPRVLTALVCLLCAVVVWVVWVVGEQGRTSPTRLVFGGQFNLRRA
ncbi:uncharacterized protein PG986_003938 [Apiospora aurea]|uniref:Uncharacterized protein n=1 Tax=Apiospora aurea TaxID=335848 RepID=A0ABR1QL56_9PEZI